MSTAAPSYIAYRSEHRMVGELFEPLNSAQNLDRFELTSQQISFYHENGYLAPIPLLNAQQLERLRSNLEQMVEPDFARAGELVGMPNLKPGDRTKMIYFQGAWLVDEAFHDLVFNPRVTVPIAQLLGTDAVRFFHDQIFYKPARHGGVVAWHQDYSYWTRTDPPGHITCFLALDDATLENGCLHVIPGSHHWKQLPTVQLVGGDAEMEGIRRVLTPEQLEQFKPTPIFLKAGEASFHHCYTLHGSYANTSDRPRRGVVLNYMKPDTRSKSDQPLMPGAAVVPPGEIVDGEYFPIAYNRGRIQA